MGSEPATDAPAIRSLVVRLALYAIAIVAAIAIVYRHAPATYFFEDDFPWLVSTWSYRPASILALSSHGHFYRPIIELYFWIAAPLFQGSSRLFHLANVALHAANGLVFFWLVRAITRSERRAFVAALFFVVLPGYVHAITWVSALAEPVGAFFGCLTLHAFLRFRQTGGRRWLAWSVCAYALSLLTHESSVVVLPLVLLVEWGSGEPANNPAGESGWLATLRLSLPYVALTIVYLAIDLPINRRNYIVDEGHYRIGLHAVRNVLDYIVSLYVGKRDFFAYGLVPLAPAGVAWRGTRVARFAICWMLLALMPFAFFTWGNTSRYLYLPGMGFGLLLAEGVEWVDRLLTGRVAARVRTVVIVLLVTIVTVRFMAFASKGVDDFAAMAETYRRYLTSFREQHPNLPRGAQIPLEPKDAALGHRYLQPLLQWEYRDPTLLLLEPAKSTAGGRE